MRQEVDSRDELMHSVMSDWWFLEKRWSTEGDDIWAASTTRGWTEFWLWL